MPIHCQAVISEKEICLQSEGEKENNNNNFSSSSNSLISLEIIDSPQLESLDLSKAVLEKIIGGKGFYLKTSNGCITERFASFPKHNFLHAIEVFIKQQVKTSRHG